MISQTAATILLGISILPMAAAQLLTKIPIVALIGVGHRGRLTPDLGIGLTDLLLWLVGVLIVGESRLLVSRHGAPPGEHHSADGQRPYADGCHWSIHLHRRAADGVEAFRYRDDCRGSGVAGVACR